MLKLADKVAVITGATSGMALAAAKALAGEGTYVYITGRRSEMHPASRRPDRHR